MRLQHLGNKAPFLEDRERLRLLAGADETGGDSELVEDREGDAAFSGAVELGDDEAVERAGLVEFKRRSIIFGKFWLRKPGQRWFRCVSFTGIGSNKPHTRRSASTATMPPNRPKGRGGGGACPGRPHGERLKAVAVVLVRLISSPSTWRKNNSRDPMRNLLQPFLLVSSALLLGAQEEIARPHTADNTRPFEESPAARVPVYTFILPPEDVISERNFSVGGRKVSVREIKPIALPEPLKESPTVEITEAMKERVREFTENNPRQQTIFLGATVYRFEDASVRTHCQLWGQNQGETISLWSSADFSLLAGVGEFVGTDGETRSLFLLSSVIDIARQARYSREHNAEVLILPEIPKLPEAAPTYVVSEGKLSEEASSALDALHMMLKNEADDLRLARDKRERVYREREAFKKANPSPPKDIILHYWNIEQ